MGRCISPTIKILRMDVDGLYAEDYSYSETFFLSYRFKRIGGCLDARFNVRRVAGEIGSLARGDRIEISYYGTVVWFGTVNDYRSVDQDLEIRCIGSWAALTNVFPDNLVFGTGADYPAGDNENEASDINDPQAILENLYDVYLGPGGDPGSIITKVSLAAASTARQVERLALEGKKDFATIAEYLTSVAGNWSVGIDQDIDFYLTNPYDYTPLDFRACEDAVYQITAMERIDSVTLLNYPTSLVIKGMGDYEETFDAEIFKYPLPVMVGITLRNEIVLSVPFVKETIEKIYDSTYAGQITVESIDAARYADMYFHRMAIDDPVQYELECQAVNAQIFPWQSSINLFDQRGQFMGEFTIEELEYESEDSNISIRSMTIRKLRTVLS